MSQLEAEAEGVLREILEGSLDLSVDSQSVSATEPNYDLAINAISQKAQFRFGVEVRSRVSPEMVLSVMGDRLQRLPKGTIPIVYAPTISPRVAEMLRERGIGYVDSAGNCWLRSLKDHLLIERIGFRTKQKPTPAAVDPFSTKSSRIVRLLLSQPMQGWGVRQLAEHPDVQVSPGLVVKVKKALLEEAYAVERDRLLYLCDATGLLKAWSLKYAGPEQQVPLYFRGDVTVAEQTIGQWCQDNALQYKLAGFSAAWRLAPEVRYSVAAVQVESRGFERKLMELLAGKYGGKQVSTGPNLYLWRPYDQSVFVGGVEADKPVTSPIQTYLDLMRIPGRGEEAGNAVFQKYLKDDYEAVAKRQEEWQRDSI